MSLYQQDFVLLPVPPRSVFSHGDEATRYRLPDFASVAELRLHTARLMIYFYGGPYDGSIRGFWTQLAVSASIVSLLVVVIALIIGRRMYEQSFWLVRVMRRPTGIIIVPNALLGFTLCEGVFTILYVVFCWECRVWGHDHSRLAHRYMMWITMTWIPLACGPFVAAYGAYFAVPSTKAPRLQGDDGGTDDGTQSDNARPNFILRLTSHSVFLNALVIVMPLAAIVSITVPTIFAHIHHERALERQQRWMTTYDGQVDFTEEMVHEAQRVWFDLGRAMYIAGCVFAVWTVYAFCLGVAYIWVTFRLLKVIDSELNKSESPCSQMSIMVTPFVVSTGQAASAISRQEDEEALRSIELEQAVAQNGQRSEAKGRGGVVGGRKGSKTDSELLLLDSAKSESSARDAPKPRRALRLSVLRTFVPNFVAKTADHPQFRSAPPLRSKQMRDLRKAYRHNLIQAIAIAPGCLVFSGIALWCAISVYSETEQYRPGGGSRGQDVLMSVVLVVTWVVVTLGLLTVLAIAQRTYEPVLSLRVWSPSSGRVLRSDGQVDREEHRQQRTFIQASTPNYFAYRFGEETGFSQAGLADSGVAMPTATAT